MVIICTDSLAAKGTAAYMTGKICALPLSLFLVTQSTFKTSTAAELCHTHSLPACLLHTHTHKRTIVNGAVFLNNHELLFMLSNHKQICPGTRAMGGGCPKGGRITGRLANTKQPTKHGLPSSTSSSSFSECRASPHRSAPQCCIVATRQHQVRTYPPSLLQLDIDSALRAE